MSTGTAETHDTTTEPPIYRYQWQQVLDTTARTLHNRLTGYNLPEQWRWNRRRAIGAAAIVLIGAVFAALILATLLKAAVALGSAVGIPALARVSLDPIEGYLNRSTNALPLPAAGAWVLWCSWGIFSLVLSWARIVGARISWVLFGMAGTAMAYLGADAPTQVVTAGITAVWWSAGSLLAFRASWKTPLVVALVHDKTPRQDLPLTPIRYRLRTATTDDGSIQGTFANLRKPITEILMRSKNPAGLTVAEIYLALLDQGYSLSRSYLMVVLNRYAHDWSPIIERQPTGAAGYLRYTYQQSEGDPR